MLFSSMLGSIWNEFCNVIFSFPTLQQQMPIDKKSFFYWWAENLLDLKDFGGTPRGIIRIAIHAESRPQRHAPCRFRRNFRESGNLAIRPNLRYLTPCRCCHATVTPVSECQGRLGAVLQAGGRRRALPANSFFNCQARSSGRVSTRRGRTRAAARPVTSPSQAASLTRMESRAPGMVTVSFTA